MYNLVYKKGNISETILWGVPKPIAYYKKKVLSTQGYDRNYFKVEKQ